MNIEGYIEEEKEWLHGWPLEPEERWGNQQYYLLANEMLTNVRRRSLEENLEPDVYYEKITKAQEIFDNLRSWLNYEVNMNDEQKESFEEQTFWGHVKNNQGSILDKKQNVWPISRDALVAEVREYLDMPYMQTNSIDYLLTDALLYAELSSFRESILTKEKFHQLYGTRWKRFFQILFFLIKWSVIGISLVLLFQESKEIFLLFGISVIAYQSVKSMKSTSSDEAWELYASMVQVYNHADFEWFNAGVIWEMCASVRKKGAVFNGVMYELLERQMARHNKSN